MLLPFRYFQERAGGDLLMRLNSNNLIREAVTNQTLSLLLDGLFVVVYVALLLVQAPLFGAVAVALGAVELLVLFSSHRSIRHLSQRTLAAETAEQSYLTEVVQGMQLVKASGAEAHVTDCWTNLFVKQLDAATERDRALAKIETAIGALRTLSPLVLLWVGASSVLGGSMSLGTMLALNTLAMAFLTPLSTLVGNAQQLQLVGAHFERIADVLTSTPEQEAPTTKRRHELAGRVEVKHLTFRYDSHAPPVLRDISFSIEPGQKIALVGPTGCGKSTLAMLLLGLYQPDEGEILYDGVPLTCLDYRHLRAQVGVVLQESFLFYGSIRENISFGDSSIPLERIIEAAKLAAIHDEIMGLPMGYETIVSEGGTSLSGGQRQRLSIARALVRQPAFAIFDEATSHLDVLTEQQVEANLSGLACTRIVIAHRLSTIRGADKIIVMNEGRIVERGLHHELLTNSSFYSELVNKQFAEHAASTLFTRTPDAGSSCHTTTNL
jgi:ABC-type bacteriocin/lantibiotic exporter with double-glycine peptidase domain